MKHIVGFSGRIDSQACARWVLNRYPVADVILTNSTGRTFFAPMVPGQHTNNIDMVLDWAMTIKRGGHKDQQAFPILMERPSCESKYGLCE